MRDDDEMTPTRRDSGALGIFEQACCSAIEGLVALGVESLPDHDRGRALLSEARDLATFFATWRSRAPANPERVAAIQRAIELHRNVAEYLVERRNAVTGSGT